MKVTSITYALTKQIRQYEPVRVEITVSADSEADSVNEMFKYARQLCEQAVIEAVQRGPVV